MAYKQKKGDPQQLTRISKVIADFSFSLVVQFLFLIQVKQIYLQYNLYFKLGTINNTVYFFFTRLYFRVF